MSNADDRCVQCGKARFDWGVHPGSGAPGSRTHAFVEPVPQPVRCPVHSECADDAYSQCQLAAGHEPKGHNFEPQAAPSAPRDSNDGLRLLREHGERFRSPRTGQRCEHDHPIEACDPCWTKAESTAAPSGDEAKLREHLGRMVRDTWIWWARKQPGPKASWLVEWDFLSEPDKEVDRLIGEILYAVGYAAGKADGAREERADSNKACPVWCTFIDGDHTGPCSREAHEDFIARRGSEGT